MIILTETWLQSNFSSSELFDESFTVHRSDRNLDLTRKKRGGGCRIAVKNNISSIRMHEWEINLPFKNSWLAINISNSNKRMYIHTSYIPPNTGHATFSECFNHFNNV